MSVMKRRETLSSPQYPLQVLVVSDGANPKPGSEATAQDSLWSGQRVGNRLSSAFTESKDAAEIFLVISNIND